MSETQSAPTAEQVFEALKQLHPNSGLKEIDVVDYLKPANLHLMEKLGYVDATSQAEYIYKLFQGGQSGYC